jgi:calcium-dependent protein kinase
LQSEDGLRSDSVCGVFSKVETIYRFEEKLGEGSFGTVWRASSLETGEQFAVKHIALTNEKSIESAGQELNVIKRLSNPYIVRLHHIVQEEGQLYLVIDLCTGGDLCQYMHDYWEVPERRRQRDMLVEMRAPLGLPWQKVAPWAWQTMVAVAYLHHNRIIHRDIKAANFMLQDDREGSLLKLIDFGYAARYRRNELMDRQVGTVRYMPPEVLEGAYTEKYDVWSCGVVIFLMTLNKYPYGGSNVDEMIRNIQTGRRRDCDLDWADVPKGLQSLIALLMTRDFRSRPSAKDILRRNGWLRKMGRPKSRSRGGQPCCSVS